MTKFYLVFILVFNAGSANAGRLTFRSNTVKLQTVVPIFDPIGPVCSGSVAPTLTTVSNNGISGVWNPSVISTTTSANYIFTPDSGQDASAISINISVIQSVTPDFSAAISLPACSTPPVLTATSPNGISGTWSPAVISASQSGVYYFTANPDQCATDTTMNVSIANLNLFCDPASSTPTLMLFDFSNINQTSFFISYTIDGGSPVSFDHVSPSHYAVPISPGQSVTFTVTAMGLSCAPSQTTTCTSLSNDAFGRETFSIYPNPVHDILTIDTGDIVNSVYVYNMFGQIVLQFAPRDNHSVIDLAELPAGVYVVNVSAASFKKSLKIIKN